MAVLLIIGLLRLWEEWQTLSLWTSWTLTWGEGAGQEAPHISKSSKQGSWPKGHLTPYREKGVKKTVKKNTVKKIQGHSYFSNAELRAHNWSEAEWGDSILNNHSRDAHKGLCQIMCSVIGATLWFGLYLDSPSSLKLIFYSFLFLLVHLFNTFYSNTFSAPFGTRQDI